jgi:Ca2+-binding RTX toxin-like protein
LKEKHVLSSIETVVGSKFGDLLIGGDLGNTFFAGAGLDIVGGSKIGDVIWAGAGKEIIRGGKGGDDLIGEAGADVFIFSNYTSVADTDDSNVMNLNTNDNRYVLGGDFIADFQPGQDKIALNEINAIVGNAGSAFSSTLQSKIFDSNFPNDNQGIIGVTVEQGLTFISVDRGFDGDLVANFYIVLQGEFNNLQASDFIL